MSRGMKLIFYIQRCPKKHLFDSNIYHRVPQASGDTFKGTNMVLSKWGVYIIYIYIYIYQELMKVLYRVFICELSSTEAIY